MSCHVMSRHVMLCHVMSRHVMSRHVMSCHVMSCHVMSCHVMSCHVMSRHVMSRHVMSCYVVSCHVISYHGMLGQGRKPCDVILVGEFVELSWPVLGLCWPFGPSCGLRAPMLGSMLALWAHLGPILGPCSGLCWPILGAMLAYFGLKNGNNDPLKTYISTMAQKRSRQRPAGHPGAPRAAPEGPKRTFVGNVTNIGRGHPDCFHNTAKRAYKTRFVLPPARNRVFWAHLGPSGRHVGPSWAPCSPILEAPLAPSSATLSQTAGWAPTTPRGSPQRPVARTRTRQRTGKQVGNHSPGLSPAATGRWGEPRDVVSEAPARSVQRWCARNRRPHQRSNARAKRKNAPKREFCALQSPKTL